MIGTIVAEKYRIDKKIGEGGMALVYKAHRISDGHTVAIKMLRKEHADDAGYLRRIEGEAAAVKSMSHKNIVKLYEVGYYGNLPFLVLEYAPGRTLKEIIEDHAPLDFNAAANYTAQILMALAHAHERGIIHRDVKPQNVIVSDSGVVKLTDFGIARDITATTLTFSGDKVLGSVHYISPEQANGKDCSEMSDIYSVGIMLFEMLTGKLPFEGDSAVAVALMHVQTELIIPDMNVDGAPIPPAFREIILRACEKDQNFRYQNAKDMRKALIKALEHPQRVEKKNNLKTLKKRASGNKKGARPLWVAPVLMIVLVLGTVALVLDGLESTGSVGTQVAVPQLVGRTLSEAENYAQLRDFTVVVEAFEANDEYPEGYVISQNPTGGNTNASSDKISVVVSSGTGSLLAPDVVGSILADAVNAIRTRGLEVNILDAYSELPAGQVVRQDPVGGVEVEYGDIITIYVSNMSEVSENVPDVTDRTLEQAIIDIKELGFTNIRIKTDPKADATAGLLVLQYPAMGSVWVFNDRISLIVARPSLGANYADFAFNAEIGAVGDSIVVTAVLEEGVEVVIYESVTDRTGSVVISVAGQFWLEGSRECILYINDVEVKRTNVTFSYRG